MRCPRCDQAGFDPDTHCSWCRFSGPAAQVEELAHIAYLLGEIESWTGLEPTTLGGVQDRYRRRRKELEVSLGLRPPPPSAEEAHELRWQLYCLQQLQAHVDDWLARRRITAGSPTICAPTPLPRPIPCTGAWHWHWQRKARPLTVPPTVWRWLVT